MGGGGFDSEIHPHSGRFDRAPLLGGVGMFAFFQQRDWDQVSACLHSIFDFFLAKAWSLE